jgi:maltose alpha-D-glucosyltransferase/alpha-amylase
MAGADPDREALAHGPHWYKSGVIYEVHVRAFYDSDSDGTGDFRGLSKKLDYIRDLGVTAIWLLPFYKSPLKDDGYDIADYCSVHPHYGTLADFKSFLRQAHRRGLRVITELVLNHTSDQHPWFQRARIAKPGSRWRKFYVWSNTGAEYRDARIIFEDVERSNWQWDPVARAYYWHRFFSHQPDLNYDDPAVHEAMIKVVDFWLDLGVDGLRLDAVPYLYERDGTNCENLPETHAFLKKLRQHVDEKYTDRMLLAEANQWPEDAVAYFGGGRGDECHMAYHFPLMPRLFMAVRMEDRQPVVDILEQTPPIPETCQWALFLRNHDELTLEMVTDEERDYMYRMYAHVEQARLNLGIRRRLAPLMNNDRKSIELLNALLFSLPGTPVLYYGDEIGLGENIFLGDRNGVRTPMQWSPDKNAGFSSANPQSLYLPIILDPGYHYEAINVEVQLGNPHSLLWWMRRLLALRKRWRALGEGKCEFLRPENRKVMCYTLRFENETLLIVANLSRFTQPVELDLSAFRQQVPIELFGRTEFPVIHDQPYFLSLGPHSFYWFSLEPKLAAGQVHSSADSPAKIPAIALAGDWREILTAPGWYRFRDFLPGFLRAQSWFEGKAKSIKLLNIKDHFPVRLAGGAEATLVLLQVEYVSSEPETYALPLAFAVEGEADRLREHSPQHIIAELDLAIPARHGLLFDAFGSPDFCGALLEMVGSHRRARGAEGTVQPLRLAPWSEMIGGDVLPKPAAIRYERSHSSVVFDDKLMLKLFRRLDAGRNPELELGRFLNRRGFPHCRTVAGALEYYRGAETHFTLALVQSFIPSAQNAWDFTLDELGRYYDRVITRGANEPAPPPMTEAPKLLQPDYPAQAAETIGTFLEPARLLGVRTAELHAALASDSVNKDFVPELSMPYHYRAVFQTMRNQAAHTLRLLRRMADSLPAETRALALRVAEMESALIEAYRALCGVRFAGRRFRIHGNCRLEQVLWTGKDFVFIGLEGDSAVPISERRLKHSPMRDVAAMVQSFYSAAAIGLELHVQRGSIPLENMPRFQSWLQYWHRWISVAFLKAYFHDLSASRILPDDEETVRLMLRAYFLDRAMNDLDRKIQQTGIRLEIPLSAILLLLSRQVPLPPSVTAPPPPAETPLPQGPSKETAA